MDLKPLYRNIPNSEGISAVKVNQHCLILSSDSKLVQIGSFLMGTVCASIYANIFMARFEEKHFITKGSVERYLR